MVTVLLLVTHSLHVISKAGRGSRLTSGAVQVAQQAQHLAHLPHLAVSRAAGLVLPLQQSCAHTHGHHTLGETVGQPSSKLWSDVHAMPYSLCTWSGRDSSHTQPCGAIGPKRLY